MYVGCLFLWDRQNLISQVPLSHLSRLFGEWKSTRPFLSLSCMYLSASAHVSIGVESEDDRDYCPRKEGPMALYKVETTKSHR